MLYTPKPYEDSEDEREAASYRSNTVVEPEIPTAWMRLGDGHLGYIGDVNEEEGTDSVILAMCGL